MELSLEATAVRLDYNDVKLVKVVNKAQYQNNKVTFI
jgi:hypothetical protein